MSGLSDLAGAADQLAQAVVSGNHKCVKNLLRSDVALHRGETIRNICQSGAAAEHALF